MDVHENDPLKNVYATPPVVGLESDLSAKTSVITKVYLRHLAEV